MAFICCCFCPLKFTLVGEHAEPFLEQLVPTAVAKIRENTGSLTVFTNATGGIKDDAIIHVTKDRGLRVVSNAGCAEKILDHINVRWASSTYQP